MRMAMPLRSSDLPKARESDDLFTLHLGSPNWLPNEATDDAAIRKTLELETEFCLIKAQQKFATIQISGCLGK